MVPKLTCTCYSEQVYLYLLQWASLPVPVTVHKFTSTCYSAQVYLYLLQCTSLPVPVTVYTFTSTCYSGQVYLYLLQWTCLPVPVTVDKFTCTCYSGQVYLYLLQCPDSRVMRDLVAMPTPWCVRATTGATGSRPSTSPVRPGRCGMTSARPASPGSVARSDVSFTVFCPITVLVIFMTNGHTSHMILCTRVGQCMVILCTSVVSAW